MNGYIHILLHCILELEIKDQASKARVKAIEESAKVMIRGENKEARQQTKKQEKIKKEARPVRG